MKSTITHSWRKFLSYSMLIVALGGFTLFTSACAEEAGEAEIEVEEGEGLEGSEIDVEGAEAVAFDCQQWDQDANQELTQEEWMGGLQNAMVVSEWDANADQQIDETEFYDNLWTTWDADASGDLTENEFNEAADAWYGDADYGTYGDWDADGDGVLTESEWEQGFNNYDLFDEWNTNDDDYLSMDEFGEGLYGVADMDDDEVVTISDCDGLNQMFQTTGMTGMGGGMDADDGGDGGGGRRRR